jgi:polyphenol oxidase
LNQSLTNTNLTGSLFRAKKLNIYFGNKHDNILLKDRIPKSNKIADLAKKLNLSNFNTLEQVHGLSIKTVTNNGVSLFEEEGDAILTNNSKIGLGIFTADCLPIIFYDDKYHSVAVVHAGWRGALAGIATKTMNKIISLNGSSPENIQIYFGPSAKGCCYQVGEDFLANLKNENSILRTNGSIYFDLAEHVKDELIASGINKNRIDQQFCICTICNNQFWSYRRDKNAGRQIIAAWLR